VSSPHVPPRRLNPGGRDRSPQTPEEHPMFISTGAIVIIVIIVLAVLFLRRH
jgi:hypothetical protein